MSGRKLLIHVCFIASGFTLGYFGTLWLKPDLNTRKIASVPLSKLGSEQIATQFIETKYLSSDISENEAQESTIRVQLTAIKNIKSSLFYTWELPADTQLVSGETSGTTGAMNAGDVKVFNIVLKKFSKQIKKYLIFRLDGSANGLPLKKEMLFSSNIEDSFEYIVQNQKSQNGIHILNKSKKMSKKFDLKKVIR